jgi:DnaJ-class molecular chaperone
MIPNTNLPQGDNNQEPQKQCHNCNGTGIFEACDKSYSPCLLCKGTGLILEIVGDGSECDWGED